MCRVVILAMAYLNIKNIIGSGYMVMLSQLTNIQYIYHYFGTKLLPRQIDLNSMIIFER